MRSDSLRPRLVQLSPPSVDLYTPSPMDALFRVHASPVPTQITLGFFGSIVIAPIDWTACLSNTGLKVVPPLTDFHTPPLAAPTYTVSRGPSCTAASAAMRPLIAADPMLRAPSPEMVAESTFTDARGGAVCAPAAPASRTVSAAAQQLPNRGVIIAQSLAGFWKRRSSIGKLASIFSIVIFCLSSLPFRPRSIAYGREQPATSLLFADG